MRESTTRSSRTAISQGSRFLDITNPTDPTEFAYFRPGTGTWATYPHKGLYYSADRNGVYVLRLTVEAGQLSRAAGSDLSDAAQTTHAPAIADADPEEEARAALERPHGAHCSHPLPE